MGIKMTYKQRQLKLNGLRFSDTVQEFNSSEQIYEPPVVIFKTPAQFLGNCLILRFSK
jgi:hypothetical protein